MIIDHAWYHMWYHISLDIYSSTFGEEEEFKLIHENWKTKRKHKTYINLHSQAITIFLKSEDSSSKWTDWS